MNGKMTVMRRQERSDHWLQVRLRTPGLVRPGAAVETRPDTHRYRVCKCALRRKFGWYRGRIGLSSQEWDEGLLFFLLSRLMHKRGLSVHTFDYPIPYKGVLLL